MAALWVVHLARRTFLWCCGHRCAKGVSRTKQMHLQAGVLWVRGDSAISGNFAEVGREKSFFCGVLIGPKSSIPFTPLHESFEIHDAHRRSLCKKQQQQKTPRAQQYTSTLLIPCAHGKLNVQHHRIVCLRQTRHGLSEGNDVAEFPPSCQLAGKRCGTCIFWPYCFY